MTMHLEGPGLTTTSYKKRNTKLTKAKQAELEQGWRERNQRLKQMGLPKETYEQYLEWVYGRGKKDKPKKIQAVAQTAENQKESPKRGDFLVSANQVTSRSEWTTGAVTTKPSPTYTGQNILGIATMHKSNMVPVFNNNEAVDISKMRR